MNKSRSSWSENSRSQSTASISEVLQRFLETYRLKDSFDETYVTAHWEELMGKPISSRTTSVFVKDATLFVQVDSAPLREELVRARSKVLERINKEMGEGFVTDIVFF